MVKNLRLTVLVVMSCFSAIAFSGCEKTEGCTDPLSENYDPSAELENNTCITQRQKFLGLYSADENCNITLHHTFFSEVRKANDNLTDILFFNFANSYVNPVRATVNKTTFIIEKQDPDATGLSVSGNGSIAGNIITVQYRIRTGSFTQDNVCIVNMTK
jgi:hypothetical protein